MDALNVEKTFETEDKTDEVQNSATVIIDETDFEAEIDKHAKSFKKSQHTIKDFRYDGSSIPFNEAIHKQPDVIDPSDSKYQQTLRSSMTYICQLCDRHYRSQSRALIHISTIHMITNLDAIKYCTTSVRNSGVIWEHVTLTVEEQLTELEERRSEGHYKSSPYTCHSCAMAFNFPDTYQNHVKKNHKNSGSFMCDICFSLFQTETELMRHERYHKYRYKCSICGYMLKCHTFISTRFTHEASHATSKFGDATVFTCQYCNNRYNDQKSLASHVKSSHFFPEEYQCLICQKILTSKPGYKTHMVTHSNDEPHECKQCGQRFKTLAKKRTHALAHYHLNNGFVCDYCNKTFPKKINLAKHIISKHQRYKVPKP